jgi:hypothetical protein
LKITEIEVLRNRKTPFPKKADGTVRCLCGKEMLLCPFMIPGSKSVSLLRGKGLNIKTHEEKSQRFL